MANDSEPNFLYRQDAAGHFEDVALNAGVAVDEEGQEQGNMGVALGDYRNVGRLDLLISHFSDEYASLYRNEGNLCFQDVSHAAGIALPSRPFVGWGVAFLDLDNAGWQDVILVNGHVYPQVENGHPAASYRQPKLVYLNQHDGTFLESGLQTGRWAGYHEVSRGLAVADLFHRGSVDVIVDSGNLA